MILEIWKSLRLQNQLIITQVIFVAIIFAILISGCIYLVQLFSVFIKEQLLQKLVLSSVVSTIQTAIIRVDTIGMVVYNKFLSERYNLKLLFEFQVQNNIKVQSLDDCLKSQNSQQFYSYQFCYGLYGQDETQSDMAQIHNFTALQNEFIPFMQQKLVPTFYNIKFGKTIFLSQYPGKFLEQIDNQLLDAIQQMESLKSTEFFQQQLNYTGSIFLSISSLDNQMYIAALLNQSENPFIQLTQQEQYFNQRLMSVFDSGFILSDSNNLDAFGYQFQNASVTGFNDDQFQQIKNFAHKNGTLKNECNFQFKIQMLCLINSNKKQQLVFSKYLVKSGFYQLAIVETVFLNKIENEFNQQLESLIDNMFLNLGLQYMTAFIICIILQIAFIKKLNRPLEDLQCIAKSHVNNFQLTFQEIASVKQTRNQTQKLAEAFFNLINLNNNNKNNQQKCLIKRQNQEFQESKGIYQEDNHKRLQYQQGGLFKKDFGIRIYSIE
ncbi:hypothetical protein pb186bvf_004912 [Paramecium bursaria]